MRQSFVANFVAPPPPLAEGAVQRHQTEKGRDEDSSQPVLHNAKSNYAGLAGVFFRER
jgi:hypothetical protein